MMKKSKSKPMTEILERLCKFEYITVVIFPEEVILSEPVDKWPLCDCLISFHSKGLSLDVLCYIIFCVLPYFHIACIIEISARKRHLILFLEA